MALMDPQQQPSLQSILKHRQQGEFVGRKEQLTLFQQNLTYAPGDDRRRFVFNIAGQGGVGKTTLLRRFSKFAEDANFITAWTDDVDEDVPAVMVHLAQQLGQQEHLFKKFNERYHRYRQLRQELEADPEAPKTSVAFVSQILTKVGVRLGRRIPIGGALFDLVDENALASQVSEWSNFIERKLTNKDEVHLIREPIAVLSPLFLEGLRNVAKNHPVALFFDVYERTSEYLDNWIRELLEGRYGEMPSNIILSIAGRDELDKNHWIIYETILARLTLDPFTEQEAREYLARKGIADEQTISVILHLSGGFPLLVASLAAESPSDPNQVGDPTGTAVERFLKWEDDPKLRQILLDAALPRLLNRDVLVALAGEQDATALFAWLLQRSFVEQKPFAEGHAKCWIYHGAVRSLMLHHKLHESPQSWTNLHSRLADYYKKLRDDLELSTEQARYNVIWTNFTVEAFYHALCQAPHKLMDTAISEAYALIDTLNVNGLHFINGEDALAYALREALWQAAEDCEATEMMIDHWERLQEELEPLLTEFDKVNELDRSFQETAHHLTEQIRQLQETQHQLGDMPLSLEEAKQQIEQQVKSAIEEQLRPILIEELRLLLVEQFPQLLKEYPIQTILGMPLSSIEGTIGEEQAKQLLKQIEDLSRKVESTQADVIEDYKRIEEQGLSARETMGEEESQANQLKVALLQIIHDTTEEYIQRLEGQKQVQEEIIQLLNKDKQLEREKQDIDERKDAYIEKVRYLLKRWKNIGDQIE